MNKKYKFYPNIIPVKGFNRSVIMDLYKGEFKFIPNYFCDFLNENLLVDFDYFSLVNFCKNEKIEFEEIELLKSFNFLIENDFIIESNDFLLNALVNNQQVITPESIIIDSIIELKNDSNWNLEFFLNLLNQLGVIFLEFRFLDKESFLKFNSIIQKSTVNNSVEYIHYILPTFKEKNQEIINSCENFFRLGKITFYDCDNYKSELKTTLNIEYSNQKSIKNDQCGCVSPDYFSFNINNYYSSLERNNCLSNKISINYKGEISNCPSNVSFGKLDELDVLNLVNTKLFQQDWNTTKDKVLVCSDCEFRYMCSDCRVFIQDTDNKLSKPSKCEYNPYISLWKHEKGYVSELESGVSISNNKVKIDFEINRKINQRIWD